MYPLSNIFFFFLIRTLSPIEKFGDKVFPPNAGYKFLHTLSDVVCNFYQSAEDVPDPRELSSEKKNLMVFDDLLLENKTPVNRIMSEEDTATFTVSI